MANDDQDGDAVTTSLDLGTASPEMLEVPSRGSHLYPTFVLALRDMREANDRDPTTGDGSGNRSWIGLAIGMIVLDTLAGDERNDVGKQFQRFLRAHGINAKDAWIIYSLRSSILHGYGPPRPEDAHNRRVALTADQAAAAVDTDKPGLVVVSVPVFCRCLVERIVTEAHKDWDGSLVNTDFEI